MKNEKRFNGSSRKFNNPLKLKFWKLIQHLGDSLLLYPLFIILILTGSQKTKICAGYILAGMLLASLTVWVLKQIFRKKRPAGENDKMYRKYDPYSFPSGHAARTWTIVAVAGICNWPWLIGSSVLALLVSYSRIRLKLHYLSDVVAGAIVGICVGIITLMIRYKLNLFEY